MTPRGGVWASDHSGEAAVRRAFRRDERSRRERGRERGARQPAAARALTHPAAVGALGAGRTLLNGARMIAAASDIAMNTWNSASQP